MRVLSTNNKRSNALEGQGALWFDIVRSSGMTYGG
jgi:hypothetical protein